MLEDGRPFGRMSAAPAKQFRSRMKLVCGVVALALVSGALSAEFSCDNSTLIYVVDDPNNQTEAFSASNPFAGGIVLTHINNATSTYHWSASNTTWVKDASPVQQCNVSVITDHDTFPKCLNVSGMPFCQAPPELIVKQRARTNLTTAEIRSQPPIVSLVCETPNTAFLNVVLGQLGSRFLAAYANEQVLKQQPEYNSNIVSFITALSNKTSCNA